MREDKFSRITFSAVLFRTGISRGHFVHMLVSDGNLLPLGDTLSPDLLNYHGIQTPIFF